MAEQDEFLKRQILLSIGDRGIDTQYKLDLPMSTIGGPFTIGFVGQYTAPIQWNAEAVAVTAAMALLPNIGSTDNVNVTGAAGGPYIINLTGALGGMPLPPEVYPLTANGANLVPPQMELPVVETRKGVQPVLTSTCSQWWAQYNFVTNLDLRSLYVKKKLLEILQGEARKLFNTEQGDRKEEAGKQYDNITDMLATCQAEITGIVGVGASSNGAYARGQMSSGKMGHRTPNGAAYGVLVRDPFTGELR